MSLSVPITWQGEEGIFGRHWSACCLSSWLRLLGSRIFLPGWTQLRRPRKLCQLSEAPFLPASPGAGRMYWEDSLPFPSTWVGSSGRDKGGVPVSRPCLEAQPIKSPRGWPRVWDRQWGPGVLVALVSFLPRVAVCLCSPSHFPLLFSASGHCVWLVIGLWYPIFPLLVSFSLLASLLCIYCQPFP